MLSIRSMVIAVVLALAAAAPVFAGPRAQRGMQAPPPAPAPAPQTSPGDQPITAGQVQRWLEAFTVLQAQDALQLSEAQYGRFVTRLKALQETRRKHLLAHQQLLSELRKLTNPQIGSNDEAAIGERLKALKEEDAAAAADLLK